MFGTFSTKTLLAAASLAVMAAAGMAPASAAPWDHHTRHDIRHFDRHDRFAHRHFVGLARINDVLRAHRYRVLGAPYFVRGHYVVRSHDRFGRQVFVEVNPHSGALIGEMRL